MITADKKRHRGARRVLEPGGRCTLVGRVQQPGRDPHAHGGTEEELTTFATLLAQTGFANIARTDHELRRETLAVFQARARDSEPGA